jgi:hypothetical protein
LAALTFLGVSVDFQLFSLSDTVLVVGSLDPPLCSVDLSSVTARVESADLLAVLFSNLLAPAFGGWGAYFFFGEGMAWVGGAGGAGGAGGGFTVC